MGITVRYPDGTRDKFNNATNALSSKDGTVSLVDDENHWSAKIPPGANVVIEGVPPCTIESRDKPTAQRALQALLGSKKELRRLFWEDVKLLKRELAKFNAHTGEWRK